MYCYARNCKHLKDDMTCGLTCGPNIGYDGKCVQHEQVRTFTTYSTMNYCLSHNRQCEYANCLGYCQMTACRYNF